MPRTKIQQRREAIGLSRAQLAALVGRTENTIYRLEIYDTKVENPNAREPGWGDLVMIAEALQCSPASLVGDVEEPLLADELEQIATPAPLANARIYAYRVLRTTLADVPFIRVGADVYVDQTPGIFESARSDDVLLCSIALASEGARPSRMLLQFHAPKMLLTNRPGLNWQIRLDDPAFSIEVLGKVMRE